MTAAILDRHFGPYIYENSIPLNLSKDINLNFKAFFFFTCVLFPYSFFFPLQCFPFTILYYHIDLAFLIFCVCVYFHNYSHTYQYRCWSFS